MAEHLPANRKQWMISLFGFALFAWAAFAIPSKLSLPQPMSFLTFTFEIFMPIPLMYVPHCLQEWNIKDDSKQKFVYTVYMNVTKQ